MPSTPIINPGGYTPARALVYADTDGSAVQVSVAAPLPVTLGAAAAPTALAGIVALDGTWSQARTLWWRNPWLLKLRRLVPAPGRTSRYGDPRLAARAEGLSTLEAVAETLRALGEPPAVPAALEHLFEQFLARWSAALSAP